MKRLAGLDGLRELPAGCVLSVGNFDGVHRGHRKILARAQELDAGGGGVAVVTFEPHPLTVLRPEMAPPRLSTVEMKREILEGLGVKYLVELPPTKEVLGVTAEAFWAILRDEVRPRHMVEGGTFNFGKGRGGTMEKLREWVKGTAVALHEVEAVSAVLCDMTPVPVSSSLVRWLVANGRVRDAGICLARPYVLEGVVVEGFKRGRTIGVPTANLRVEGQVVPIDGVYAGRCVVDGKAYPAATSIGRMPTFGEGLPHQVEAHLVGFDGDLYGRTLRLDLLDYLREQWKLPDIGSLKRQIERDVERTVALAGGSARADERGAGVRPA